MAVKYSYGNWTVVNTFFIIKDHSMRLQIFTTLLKIILYNSIPEFTARSFTSKFTCLWGFWVGYIGSSICYFTTDLCVHVSNPHKTLFSITWIYKHCFCLYRVYFHIWFHCAMVHLYYFFLTKAELNKNNKNTIVF